MNRYLNLRVIGAAITFAIALFCISAIIVWLTRPGPGLPVSRTAVLHVIPLPTATQVLLTPTPIAEQTPSADVPPSPNPGEIMVGAFVQVSGTGGDGLRMRSKSGLDGEVLFLGLEDEVFRVEDGPQEADGFSWWLLVAPYDETVQGWAVSNYLDIVQNP
ncbi:MAG: hypothetical protein PVF74_01825 [Anaerolineales bacterium]